MGGHLGVLHSTFRAYFATLQRRTQKKAELHKRHGRFLGSNLSPIGIGQLRRWGWTNHPFSKIHPERVGQYFFYMVLFCLSHWANCCIERLGLVFWGRSFFESPSGHCFHRVQKPRAQPSLGFIPAYGIGGVYNPSRGVGGSIFIVNP